MDKSMPEELKEALQDFEDRRLWGQIQIDYQAGELVLIRKVETVKLKENNRHGKSTRF